MTMCQGTWDGPNGTVRVCQKGTPRPSVRELVGKALCKECAAEFMAKLTAASTDVAKALLGAGL